MCMEIVMERWIAALLGGEQRFEVSSITRSFRAADGAGPRLASERQAGPPAEKQHPHALMQLAHQISGFCECQSRPGKATARAQVDRLHDALCDDQRPASLQGYGRRTDDDLLSQDFILRVRLPELEPERRIELRAMRVRLGRPKREVIALNCNPV